MGKLCTKNLEILPLPSLTINMELCYYSLPTKCQYLKEKNTLLTLLIQIDWSQRSLTSQQLPVQPERQQFKAV